MRVRIDVAEFFNKLINRESDLMDIQDELEALDDSDEINPEDLPKLPIEDTMDVAFQIIAGYLDDIAERAIELNDKKLLELCEGLGLIKNETK